MSLLLKAFPHGRPYHRAHPHARALVTLLATLLALVVATVPSAGPAAAASKPAHRHHAHAHARAHHPVRAKAATKHPRKGHPRPKRKVVGQPPNSFEVAPTSYFSFPNRSAAEQMAIRKRVLLSIKSTWGGARTRAGTPRKTNGTIRIATWSFDDWKIAKALSGARKRGVSVQVIAAKSANKDHRAWHWLQDRLGQRLYKPGNPATRDAVSFARECQGACRGPGGTAHSKYFLFDNVGPHHLRHVTFQTSMNLTSMAYQGQWNQAQVHRSPQVYDDFLAVFRQARIGRPVASPYHVEAVTRSVADYFFPRPHAVASEDPVMQILGQTACRGATAGSPSGRTRIRIAQYAIYGDRGVWIAKKLRQLWNAGCNIAIIYSVSSRPVLSILRSPTGRGPIPMKQSVVKDYWGNIVKYNHSKWMTIAGRWGRATGTYVTFSGSANWANLAFGDDEQMQRITSRRETLRYNAVFAKTWKQRSSTPPAYGRLSEFGRSAAIAPFGRDIPRDAPDFGHGVYRHMTRD